MVGILIAIAIQCTGLVWQAATTVAAINSLQGAVAELRTGNTAFIAQLAGIAVRMGVLESKVDDLRSRDKKEIQ